MRWFCVFFFFFKQKTAYEMLRSLVGSEMCIRDRFIHGALDTCCIGIGKKDLYRAAGQDHITDRAVEDIGWFLGCKQDVGIL